MSNTMQRGGWLPAPTTFAEALDMATQLGDSDLVPPAYRRKPMAILIVADFAHRVGLPLLTALQGVAVINGKPTIWGDCALAVARSHPDFEGMAEKIEGDGDERRALCQVRRRGQEPTVTSFSVAMARKAGLWGKPGPWQSYPARMLAMRARLWAIRAAFADALQGIGSADELADVELAEGRPMPQPDGEVPPASPNVHHGAPPAADAAPAKPRRSRTPTGRPRGRPRKQPIVVEAAIPEPSSPLPGQHPLPPDMAPQGVPPGWAERIAAARSGDELVQVGRMVSEARLPEPEMLRLREAYAQRQRQLLPPMPGPTTPAGDAEGIEALRRRAAERAG